MTDRSVEFRIGDLLLAGLVMPASGCFGPEMAHLVDLDELAAVVTKTVFLDTRAGNRAPRVTETPDGMLNSVGIPSPGAQTFIERVLPRYAALRRPVIVSVGGTVPEEYADLVRRLEDEDVAAYELNVSCPNLEQGGTEIGANATAVHRAVSKVARISSRPVVAKLAPMVSDITEIARAAADAGAAALTVANSVPAMGIDGRTGRPVLGNTNGGLSGPAVKPIIVRLVHEIAQDLPIPIIGCGGVQSPRDAYEYLTVGAVAVQVGTANFASPPVMGDIARGLKQLAATGGLDG